MKKDKIAVMLVLCFGLLGCANSRSSEVKLEEEHSTSVVNKESNIVEEESIKVKVDFDNALKSGYVIRKSIDNKEAKEEIYNNKGLDEFVKNVKAGKSDNITIVEYLSQGDNLTINKLSNLIYNGENIIVNYYDVFTDRNNFKVADEMKFTYINMREVDDCIIYSLSSDKGEEINLMSFKKDEIKN